MIGAALALASAITAGALIDPTKRAEN